MRLKIVEIPQGIVEAMLISPRNELLIAGAYFLRDKEVFLSRWDGFDFHIIQVESRARALAVYGFSVFVGGDFGLAIYEEFSGIRLMSSQFITAGGSLLGGHIFSLAVEDDCVYISGRLLFESGESGAVSRVRLVRGCVSTQNSQHFVMEAIVIGTEGRESGEGASQSVQGATDWQQGIFLFSTSRKLLTNSDDPDDKTCLSSARKQ